MKLHRFLLLALLAALLLSPALPAAEAPRAKYVFLMIGDGMGRDIRQLFHDQAGPMTLGSFEVKLATGTDNAGGTTTDSAASGTALACGIKTVNGALGVDADGRPVTSLAKILQRRGYRIGVVSSVAINDATPGAHYANRVSRKLYAGVLSDLVASRFDFFGVARLALPKDYREKDFERLLQRRGYEVGRDAALFELKPGKSTVVFGDLSPVWDGSARTAPSLADFTREAAKFLKNDRGFFLVVEGGAIDHRAHNNDSGGVIREMYEFDAAVAAAVEFYRRHPDETLVVVTADHDTGGLTFVPGGQSEPGFWKKQTMPLTDLQKELSKQKKEKKSAAEMIECCRQVVGVDAFTPAEREQLEKAAALFLADGKTERDRMTGYGRYNPLAVEALRVRDLRCGFRFSTFGHTNRKVETDVLGAGAGLFREPLENSDIPHRIAAAMLGDDTELKQGAKEIPFPPTKAKDYFAPQSATADSLTFRYGLIEPRELDFVLAGGGKEFRQRAGAPFGRVVFPALAADTAYVLTVAGKAMPPVRLAARTLPALRSAPLFSAGVVSDPHVTDAPDLMMRLHSRSAEIFAATVKTLAAARCELLLLPGDLTDRGRLSELLLLQAALKENSLPRIATFGNHDPGKDRKALALWAELFGPAAGIREYKGIQFLWLDTGDGKLDKPANRAAVEALDPARPAVVISHYQLVRDDYIKDRDAAIADADAPGCRAMLEKLGQSRAVIYVGHKNIATETKLGHALQINLPQTTQYPAGALVLDFHPEGIRQRFVPSLDPYCEEYSRRLGEGPRGHAVAARDRHSFAVWNRFIPWPETR